MIVSAISERAAGMHVPGFVRRFAPSVHGGGDMRAHPGRLRGQGRGWGRGHLIQSGGADDCCWATSVRVPPLRGRTGVVHRPGERVERPLGRCLREVLAGGVRDAAAIPARPRRAGLCPLRGSPTGWIATWGRSSPHRSQGTGRVCERSPGGSRARCIARRASRRMVFDARWPALEGKDA